MQFQFRVDDDNYLTIELQLQVAGPESAQNGPELIAATVVDSKLSMLQDDELFDLAAQIVDYFSRSQADHGAPSDWRAEWLAATKR